MKFNRNFDKILLTFTEFYENYERALKTRCWKIWDVCFLEGISEMLTKMRYFMKFLENL